MHNPAPLSPLKKFLDNVGDGEIQLPDFQREWIWDDDHVRSLLASICQGFPIGAIMMLEAGGDLNFKSRLIEGVPDSGKPSPDYFLLDGQQRITSLYQTLRHPRHSEPVVTFDRRGKRITRWYYIDMLQALKKDPEWEYVIRSVSKDKRVTQDFGREIALDLSSPELEYKQHMMPTSCLLEGEDWVNKYCSYWNDIQDKHPYKSAHNCCTEFKSRIRDKIIYYQLTVICLPKETPKEAVCTVFEKVNTGGVPLNTFELVTATFAADNFSLRDDWMKRKERLHEKFPNLQDIEGEQFLQALTLLASQSHRQDAIASGVSPGQAPAISCRKRDILDLNLGDYKIWADKTEHGFILAAQFLRQQFIFNKQGVPYNTQLVPLAAIYASLEKELQPASAIRQLEQWFWSGIFSEAYGSAVETQFALDLAQVGEYIRSGTEPRLVTEASLTAERLVSLRTRNSAAYKGLYALQMRGGAADWRTGKHLSFAILDGGNVDIHHIFPVAWCTDDKHKVPKKLYNSIINKTPIDAKTNQTIGGKAPSVYLRKLEEEIGSEILNQVLLTHWTRPELLRSDKFSKSFIERGQAMLDLIYKTIGKPKIDCREVFEKEITSAGYSLDA